MRGCNWNWDFLPLLVLSWLLNCFIKQISCKKILKIRVEGNPVFVVVCGRGERTQLRSVPGVSLPQCYITYNHIFLS